MSVTEKRFHVSYDINGGPGSLPESRVLISDEQHSDRNRPPFSCRLTPYEAKRLIDDLQRAVDALATMTQRLGPHGDWDAKPGALG